MYPRQEREYCLALERTSAMEHQEIEKARWKTRHRELWLVDSHTKIESTASAEAAMAVLDTRRFSSYIRHKSLFKDTVIYELTPKALMII